MFIHLHGHSHYSLLEGLGGIGKVIDKAKALGMDSIAITDYSNMYGAVEFYKAAKKAGIKAIIGVEMCVVQNIQRKDAKEIPSHIVLLAANVDGYQNLMKLVSASNIEGYNGKSTIDLSLLKEYSHGMIGFMGGEKSVLGQMICANEDRKKLSEIICSYKEIFGNDNFFLEYIAQDHRKNNDLKLINNTLIDLAEKTSTKIIVNPNYHYINKDDKEAYEVLLCIKDGKMFHDSTRQKISQDYHILSEEELVEILKKNGLEDDFISSLIQANFDLAQSIDLKVPLGQILFPKYESPDHIKETYEKFKDSLVE